ncbi:MAG: mechanosensitive ion channel family protein [Candidatus Omnitrophota bacterium]
MSRIKTLISTLICFLSAVPARAQTMGGMGAPEFDPAELFSFYTKDQIYQQLGMTLVAIILAYAILFLLVRVINHKVENIKSRHTFRKNASYLINFLLIITVLFIWMQKINSLTIFLGFASAGLALALQEVILCVAGWFMIIGRHPFEVGDRIEIAGIRGDVIDIRVLQTSILEIGNWVDADQSTGRIVNIPNSFVYKHPNFNYTRGFEFIWHEIPVTITFESDWRKAKEIMLTHGTRIAEGLAERVASRIERMKDRYMIYYGKFTPIVYVDIQDSGVRLTLRYLTEAKKRRSTEDELSQAILDGFYADPDVTLAYTTYRIVKND